MKLKLFVVPFTLFLAIAFIVASCSKTGPAGATGPAGPAGPQGSSGTQGTNGAPGAPGTANVIYSDWLNVKFSGVDSTGWFAAITATQLVDSIINHGDIKVYLNAGSDSADNQFIFPLPITDILITGAIINPYYQSQTINIVSTADVSSDSLRGYHYFQYRYILIPGGIKSGRMANGAASTAINWDDYNQVKKYLGLKN